MHFAAYNGHPSVVRVLVAAGAEVSGKDAAGSTPLHKAMDWREGGCHEGVARELVAGGLTLNPKPETLNPQP
jgi:ankyrin repeat protein